MHYLIVVDMQRDFVDGALGTKEAVAIVPRVAKRIGQFTGRILFTRDTHGADYLSTQEGRRLPIPHCIKGTPGWEIVPELDRLRREPPIDKPSFGSPHLGELLKEANEMEAIESITLIGLCTDICILANALLIKSFLPEIEVIVDRSCCAGVTPESHEIALRAMKGCQISIVS